MKLLLITLAFVPFIFAGSPQSVSVMTSASIGTASAVALAANGNRGYLLIQNNGSVTCQVKFGSAITSTEGVQLTAGQYYEPWVAPKEAVYMKCAGAATPIQLVEGNW